MTASSSGEYAHASLLLTLGALSANLVNDATLLIPFIKSKMNTNGVITDEETRKSISYTFASFLKLISHS